MLNYSPLHKRFGETRILNDPRRMPTKVKASGVVTMETASGLRVVEIGPLGDSSALVNGEVGINTPH